MASNDQVILDQVLRTKWAEIGGTIKEHEFFEIFVSEQILKEYDLSYEEITSGVVGGGNDGGIDSIYLLINGEFVYEDTDVDVFKKDIIIELVVIQSKTSPSFTADALDKFASSASELFDLSRDLNALQDVYNPKLLEIVDRFRTSYQKLAARFPVLLFKYFYVTRGDAVHQNVGRKVDPLAKIIEGLFSAAEFQFSFIGAARLLEIARTARTTSFVLNLAESPISAAGDVGFIALVKLSEFFDFLHDENGYLRKHIFEANVRDYQGNVVVNEGIQRTLQGDRKEDFWWLNNGVTIVATNASQSAKAITIENPYIVNGLQSSTELFKYFKDSNTEGDERHILVRVVVPTEEGSRDRIIKATNSQTAIPGVSLRATEKIHRNIEEYLKPYQIYYDRRKNFYKNEARPIDKIISIGQVSQSVMSMLLKRPNDARARPSSLLKDDDDYIGIFNPDYPIEMYKKCAELFKSVQSFVRSDVGGVEAKDRNNIRFYLMMSIALRMAGKINVTAADIAGLDTSNIDDAICHESLAKVWAEYQRLGGTDQVAKGTELRDALIVEI